MAALFGGLNRRGRRRHWCDDGMLTPCRQDTSARVASETEASHPSSGSAHSQYTTPTIPKYEGPSADGAEPGNAGTAAPSVVSPAVPSANSAELAAPAAPAAPAGTHLFSRTDSAELSKSVTTILSESLIARDPTQAARALITLLSGVSGKDATRRTTPAERRLVVERMLQFGTSDFLAAFTPDLRAREILADWLSDATPPRKTDVEDQSEYWKEVLVPLLKLLQRLPIELDHLKDHVGLGKLITGVQKRARNEQAVRLADAIKDQWSALVSSARTTEAPASRTAAAAAPKRPAAAESREAAAKRVRSNAEEVRPASRAATTAKAPAASKPAATAAATPPPTRRTARTPTTQSNANKDLASFMSLIDQQQPPSAAEAPKGTSSAAATSEKRRRKKSVHWRDHDGQQLVAVRMIEPAIYEDDETGGHSSMGAGAMDIEEGGAFRLAHTEMDEQIDWYAPLPLQLPDAPPRGEQSQAKYEQEERERATLLVMYLNPGDIPESPAEPDSAVLAWASRHPEPRLMTTGSSIEPFSPRAETPGSTDGSTVSSASGASATSAAEPPPAATGAPPALPPALLALMEHLGANGLPPPPPPPGAFGADNMPFMPPFPMDPSKMAPGGAPEGGGNGSGPEIPAGMPPWPFPFPPDPSMFAQMAGMPPAMPQGPPEGGTQTRSRGGRGRRRAH